MYANAELLAARLVQYADAHAARCAPDQTLQGTEEILREAERYLRAVYVQPSEKAALNIPEEIVTAIRNEGVEAALTSPPDGSMPYSRLEVLLCSAINWASEHSDQLLRDLISGTGITSDELLTLGYHRTTHPGMHAAADGE